MDVTPLQAARYFEQFAQNLRRELPRAEEAFLIDARVHAIALSQGPFSQAELDRMGNPYGVRYRGRFRPDPRIINYQTGLFAHSWFFSGPVITGMGDMQSSLTNLAPYSGYMRGTVRMIPRPIDVEVVYATSWNRYNRLCAAVEISMP